MMIKFLLITQIQCLMTAILCGLMVAPCPHKKIELEGVNFTGSNFSGDNLGYNSNLVILYPKLTLENARRPTSNTLSNIISDSLQVVVKRVSILLNKPEDYTLMVVNTFRRIRIHSCHTLYEALVDIWDNQVLATTLTRRFKEVIGGLVLCHKQLSFFRCASMYMDGRWEYDHE